MPDLLVSMRCYCVAIVVLIHFSVAVGQPEDKSMWLLPSPSGGDEIDSLHNMVVQTWLNYPDQAMEYARQAYALSLEQNDQKKISGSLRLISGVYYYKGNYDSVLAYANESLAIGLEVSDTLLINNALNNIGVAYYNLGSYQNALENLLRALHMKIAIGEIYGRSLTLNNIGMVYSKLKDYNKGRAYYQRGLEVARQYNNPNLLLYSQNNIGTTYLQEGDIATAQRYFEQSLSLNVDNKNWTATAYSGMGQVYQQKEEYERSRKYFAKALALREEIGEKNGISEIFYHYSKEELRKENYDSAVQLLQRSQAIADHIGSKERMFENYLLFVRLYQQQGLVEKAFEYQTKLLHLRDTLFNESLAHNLASIHLKIQEEENQKVLEYKEKQLYQKRSMNVFLIVIFVLVVLLAGLIFFAYSNNKKITGLLAERKDEILSQKEEIEAQKESLVLKNIQLEKAHTLISAQNISLEKYNAKLQSDIDERTIELEARNEELKLANLELDNFLYKSSHDIKGPLATLMGICNVALMDIKDDKSRQYLSMLAKTARGLNDILARLKTISDINSLELKVKKIDLTALIVKCINQVENIEGAHNFNIDYEVDKNVSHFSDPLLTDLIFFNMIHNAVKFKSARTEIGILKVKVAKEEGDVVVHFMDNGIGINEEDVDDIFQMFSKTALKHQTLGLGLYIVKQSVQKLGGEIMLLNDDPQYTHFRIVLPQALKNTNYSHD